MYVRIDDLSEVRTLRFAGWPPDAEPYVELPDWAHALVLQAETQDVRFVFGQDGDEGSLAADAGFVITAGAAPIRVEGRALLNSISFLEATSGAILNVGVLAS